MFLSVYISTNNEIKQFKTQSFGIIGPANFGHDWSKQVNFQPVSKHLLAHAKIQLLDMCVCGLHTESVFQNQKTT